MAVNSECRCWSIGHLARTSVARAEVLPSGFAALDERLPAGWPRSVLMRFSFPVWVLGELTLLLPLLAALTSGPQARSCVWVAPPFEPFAPALAAHGVALSESWLSGPPTKNSLRGGALWPFEQPWVRCLRSRDGLGEAARGKEVRRLQLRLSVVARSGCCFGLRRLRGASHAALRMTVEPSPTACASICFKSKGGVRGCVEINLLPAGN